MATATINPNGGTTANINATTRGPQKVSVTTPTAVVDGVTRLRNMTDVNSSTLEDGALIQYDASSDKFVTKTEISTESGTITFNGGSF